MVKQQTHYHYSRNHRSSNQDCRVHTVSIPVRITYYLRLGIIILRQSSSTNRTLLVNHTIIDFARENNYFLISKHSVYKNEIGGLYYCYQFKYSFVNVIRNKYTITRRKIRDFDRELKDVMHDFTSRNGNK